MTLSEQLLEQAKVKDLCKPFQRDWRERSIPEFIEFYKANPDWCLDNNFPSLEMLKKYADTEDIRKQGVFVCQHNIEKKLTDKDFVCVFNECTGLLTISDYDVARCYVSLDSQLTFNVNGNSILLIDIYDNANIDVHTNGNSECTIYKYGDGIINAIGKNINIIDKRHE